MNTLNLGIPLTAGGSDNHLIPAKPSQPSSMIERLAASHAEVIAKWNNNFALDLRLPEVEPLPS
jgi:hypothetical protein